MVAPPVGSGWIGRDLARLPRPRRRARRQISAALVGLLAAALALAALRIDNLRMRYGLGEALKTEKALLVEHRELTARVRHLRDPSKLAALARKRGLARPERIIDLRSDSRRARRP